MPGVTAKLPLAKTELTSLWRFAADDYVVALSLAKDGERGVVGLGSGDVIGLELSSGREIFRRTAHAGGVLGVSLAPDGKHFVTCGQEASAKLWSVDGEFVRGLQGGVAGWVEHVAWAPAGGRVATASGRTVRIWSANGEPIVETEPLESSASGLAWRSDGTGLAATCYGGVHLLPFVEGARARHLAWKGSLISLAWSPDAKVIACGSQDASVHFWRLKSGQDSQMSGYSFKPKALAWDFESKLLATSGDASVTVWDFRGRGPEGTAPLLLVGHTGVTTRLAFAPRSSVLASGSQDTSVLVWEPRKSLKPTRFAFLEDEVTALEWLARGDVLVGADASGNVIAWRLPGQH